MKKKSLLFMLLLCLFVAGGAWADKDISHVPDTADGEGGGQQKDTGIRLTVWLDEDNEYSVRNAIWAYEYGVENKNGSGLEDYFPDIQWNLVEKNYLSPGQYRQELKEALENGEGPDIIYMDAWNGVNPKELMEAGALADLGDITYRLKDPLTYAPGALEAGMQDGRTYVQPLYMECPVVFGLSGELEEAGIQADEGYGSLEEFLDALLQAQETTGKQIFEDDAAVDWLERYYLPQDPAQAEALTAKLEQVRAFCGEHDGSLDAYREVAAGNCLLGGCGLYDYKALGMNVSLFGEGQSPVLLSIPDSGGSVRGIITHSAAVNADSEHVEAARLALHQFRYVTAFWAPDLYAMDDARATQLKDVIKARGVEYLRTPSVLGVSGQGITAETAEAFVRCTVGAIEDVAYVQEFGDRMQETDAQGQKEEKKVVSIWYPDCGEGEDFPITRWLRGAEAAFEQAHSGVDIQLLPAEHNAIEAFIAYKKMDKYGVAPDAAIYQMTNPEPVFGVGKSDSKGADLRALLEESAGELEFLPETIRSGVAYGGDIVGLPVQAKEFGVWCSREALAQAGLPADWKPADAGELTAGFRKLKKLCGPGEAAVGMDADQEVFEAMALFLADSPEGLLTQQEDGSWRCSGDGWISSLSWIKKWKEEGLAKPVDSEERKQAIQDLAEGRLGMLIASSTLSGWFDGSYGLKMTQEQQEQVVFLPLSPAVSVDMFFISNKSDNVKEVFSFWKEAVQHPDYEAAIRENSYLPVTELSETVCQILPSSNPDPVTTLDDLWDALWETDAAAEELAEEYPWFEWETE